MNIVITSVYKHFPKCIPEELLHPFLAVTLLKVACMQQARVLSHTAYDTMLLT